MARTYYNDFFKLSLNPFGETPDPKFFFASKTHQSALSALQKSIEQGKGFSLLTGEVGMGKTLVSRILLGSTAGSTDTALILYPNCNEAELIRSICKELEIDTVLSSENAHKNDLDRLNEFLLNNAKKGRKTVLVIDEAQNMPYQTLETVRLLSNLETNNQKLIHTILCAQPEFLKRLSQEDFRQLHQRIGISVKLDPLDVTETELYIKHRIECAGGSNFLRFDADSCKLIQKTSGGIPRAINHICDQLLALALKRKARLITKLIVREHFVSSSKKNWITKIWRREEKISL
jgi:general secretion pathway protein A